jgi:protein-tyrosine-phosphatase
MAEGFAKHYGQDVMIASSSGLAPTPVVASETVDTMAEHNVDISKQYPKRFNPLTAKDVDLIVNMSGFELPGKPSVPIREWKVRDPYGDTKEVYLEVANDLEMRVMRLILEFRRLADN